MWEKFLGKVTHQDIANISALETGAEPIYIYHLQHLLLVSLLPFALFVAFARLSFLMKVSRKKIEKVRREKNIYPPSPAPFMPLFVYIVMDFMLSVNGSTVFNMFLTAAVVYFVVRREHKKHLRMYENFG